MPATTYLTNNATLLDTGVSFNAVATLATATLNLQYTRIASPIAATRFSMVKEPPLSEGAGIRRAGV